MTNQKSNNQALEFLLIEEILIKPIENICEGLRASKFRDKDLAYLDENLNKFISLAASVLGFKKDLLLKKEETEILNGFTANQYLKRFDALLTFFRSFN
jgi:hypothetical protein